MPKHLRLPRRRFLLGAGGVAAAAGAGWGATFLTVYSQRKRSNVGKLDFRNELRIPDLLHPDPAGDGRRHYRLTLAPGTSRLLPGRTTPTWGANGPYLAPTLRARRGDRVALTVRNRLPEATTLHWHGMLLPARMDGGPHQMIEAGRDWQPTWTVHQPAATLWYHPHPHGSTGTHVYRGVAGMIILDDEHSERAALPRTYGVDDVPLVIQDKNFHDDGSLDLTETKLAESVAGADNLGVLGDTILVNGTYDPHFKVTTRRVRLRLLNGSNARMYWLGFTDGRTFHQVATDAGLLARPRPLERLLLAPGERAEIVVSFAPGDEAVLRSFEPDLGLGFPTERFMGGDDTFDIIALRAGHDLASSPALPTRIEGAAAPVEAPADARHRTLEFTGVQINGKTMDMTRVDEVIPAGATEVWEIERGDDWVHVLHVHGAVFHVLDINGSPPPAYARGPKDTFYLHEFGKAKIAIRFDTLTDPKAPYMYHCHVLRHEDDGMMGQFTVVAPGTEKQAPRTLPDAGAHQH
ncbi:multicopper oxidase domain-containing protein [Streptomyces sp. SID5785]|uniref:multicopper oxidase family protein n=1 Tax=Streptomyces sp. SID5785 TaxID=2690309 RepID=UPI0013614CEE|nr:multicopper oxidase domain-containing protein [Streptomyces sp. SID5785]MZD07780.1 multicopper oxidase domain-containing protein [Streptomyces sp. SID5785]